MTIDNPIYMSAYGMAVKAGFVGSPEEWLESLKTHVHIKWARNLPANDAEMTDEPGDWMGICTDGSKTAPDDYRRYTWVYVRGADAGDLIAEEYNPGKSYKKGDIVRYMGRLYVANSDTAGGVFNRSKWDEITLGDLLGGLQETVLGPNNGLTTEQHNYSPEQRAQMLRNLGIDLDLILMRGRKLIIDENWVVDSESQLPAPGTAGRVMFVRR